MPHSPTPSSGSVAAIRQYWNVHIHDLEISRHAPGTPGFFADLDEYHFDKLHHLLRLVDFNGYAGRRVLDVRGQAAVGRSALLAAQRAEDAGESLRLLYVAMTRASRQLVVHWASSKASTRTAR